MFSHLKPNHLHIEGCSICQLRCPDCPTTSGRNHDVVGKGFLKAADLRPLLQRNSHIRSVEFENRGELFLNPNLPEILEMGFKKGLSMSSNSGVNLNHVSSGVLEQLVKFRFKSLLCSIDGASEATYRQYRVGGSFSLVIENIKMLQHFKKQYHSPFPELTWQFIVFGHNEHELPAAREMAHALDMKFIAKMAWDPAFSPIRDREFVLAHTGWKTVTREEHERITGANYMRSVCFALWSSPRINWDGAVLGCCWNHWGTFGGNAFTDGFLPAIHAEKMREAKKMLKGKSPPRKEIPCTICPIYTSMQKTGHFLEQGELFFYSWKNRFSHYLFPRFPWLRRVFPF